MQNLESTKAEKVLKTGIKILTRRVWVGKILHNIRLKIQGRRSALLYACALNKKGIMEEIYRFNCNLKVMELYPKK